MPDAMSGVQSEFRINRRNMSRILMNGDPRPVASQERRIIDGTPSKHLGRDGRQEDQFVKSERSVLERVSCAGTNPAEGIGSSGAGGRSRAYWATAEPAPASPAEKALKASLCGRTFQLCANPRRGTGTLTWQAI